MDLAVVDLPICLCIDEVVVHQADRNRDDGLVGFNACSIVLFNFFVVAVGKANDELGVVERTPKSAFGTARSVALDDASPSVVVVVLGRSISPRSAFTLLAFISSIVIFAWPKKFGVDWISSRSAGGAPGPRSDSMRGGLTIVTCLVP